MSDQETNQVPADTQSPEIAANFNKEVDAKEATFRFKKDKMGNKRPNVELKNLPVPSVEGIIAILTKGGKELELLQDAIYDVVRGVVADWVGSDESNGADKFNPADFTWEKIANMPKEDRRSSTISPEVWEGFSKSYMDTMPSVTGKTAEAVANAVQVYLKKFAMVKTNKPVIQKLKEQLGLYMEHAKDAEDYQEVLDLLIRRADTYLAADDVQALISNL